MKRLWFLIPLAAFLALASCSPSASSATRARCRRRSSTSRRRSSSCRGSTSRARRSASTTCTGKVVACSTSGRRGASPAARSTRCCSSFAQEARRAGLRPQLQGHARRTRCAGWRASAIRTTLSFFDEDGRVGIDFGVYGVPETFVIDGNGVIRYKHIGPITPEVLANKIEPLVQEARRVR